jgi:hypothetical protein
VWPERLGKFKKFFHLIESRNHDPPAGRVVPKPVTIPRVPNGIVHT